MIEKHAFTVYGDPRGKGRPRFFRNHVYTDAVTAEYEGRVGKMWKSKNFNRIEKTPTTIIIDAFFRVPVSLSKTKRAGLYGKPFLNKPDSDNIAKIILDALNGLAYDDDAQIETLCVTKRYVHNEEEEPRVVITILAGEEK